MLVYRKSRYTSFFADDHPRGERTVVNVHKFSAAILLITTKLYFVFHNRTQNQNEWFAIKVSCCYYSTINKRNPFDYWAIFLRFLNKSPYTFRFGTEKRRFIEMIKLLIIADDFTGALDTGIQFRGDGTVLRFGKRDHFFEKLPENTDVLVIDAETRHLPAEDAGRVVGQIVKDAASHGVSCIYKKTDSGLRGNIGSELAAVLAHSAHAVLHFVPAFPRLGRITRQGIHYVDGQEVAHSVFGRDPFEPVRFSDVRQIIAQQTAVPAVLADPDSSPAEGIAVYDAQSDEDIFRIAQSLHKRDELHLLAGCAGFASVLPQLLGIRKRQQNSPSLPNKLLTVCGSVNAITLKQMDTAQRAGVPRVRLSVPQKLDVNWLGSPQGEKDLQAMLDMAIKHPSSIIECDGLSHVEELDPDRNLLGMDQEAMRRRISHTMGAILKSLLDKGLDATMLVTGGDTLMAFMELAGLTEMIPICEYAPGVVLAQVHYNGRDRFLLSKSGGFGDAQLLLELEHRITAESRKACPAVC